MSHGLQLWPQRSNRRSHGCAPTGAPAPGSQGDVRAPLATSYPRELVDPGYDPGETFAEAKPLDF